MQSFLKVAPLFHVTVTFEVTVTSSLNDCAEQFLIVIH